MSTPQWTIELHAHSRYSHDCLTSFDQLQQIVKERNIDKLAITDHNTTTGALEMARLYPMWVIPGVEVMTTKGELLAWYITDDVPAHRSPQETIDILRQQGALISVSHPFDRHRGGAWAEEDLLAIVDQVDAIEVHNARCLHKEDNHKARAFAKQHGKLFTAGSDAHIKAEYGKAVMRVPPFASNAAGLKQALQAATYEPYLSSPLVHMGSTYAKWAKRLIPSLRAG